MDSQTQQLKLGLDIAKVKYKVTHALSAYIA